MNKEKNGYVSVLGMFLIFHSFHLYIFYFLIKDFVQNFSLSIVSLLPILSRIALSVILGHLAIIFITLVITSYLSMKLKLNLDAIKFSILLSGLIYFPFLFIPFTYVYYLPLVGSIYSTPLFSVILSLVGMLIVISNVDLVNK